MISPIVENISLLVLRRSILSWILIDQIPIVSVLFCTGCIEEISWIVKALIRGQEN